MLDIANQFLGFSTDFAGVFCSGCAGPSFRLLDKQAVGYDRIDSFKTKTLCQAPKLQV